jgi:hypothetical protein
MHTYAYVHECAHVHLNFFYFLMAISAAESIVHGKSWKVIDYGIF